MRIISANLGHTGHHTANALSELHPDILCVQETHADPAWITDMERTLGMRAWVTLNPANQKLCTGVLVRGELLVDEPRLYPHSVLWHIPPTDLTVRLASDPDRPWTVISAHFAYHSPRLRALEAEDLLRAVDAAGRFGGELIVAGDMNELPRRRHAGDVPDIDWATVTDPAHPSHRAQHNPRNDSWSSVTNVDDTLINAGLVDAAVRIADSEDQLDATAGHTRPDQGGPCRIDRAYLSSGLADRVTDVAVIDIGGDHQAVVVDLFSLESAGLLPSITGGMCGNQRVCRT